MTVRPNRFLKRLLDILCSICWGSLMRKYRNCQKYYDSIDPTTIPKSNQEIQELLACLSKDTKLYVNSLYRDKIGLIQRFKKSILPKLEAKGLLKNFIDQMDKHIRIELYKTVSVLSNLERSLEKVENDFKWWIEKYGRKGRSKGGETTDPLADESESIVDALKLCYIDLVNLSMLISQMFFALEFSCRNVCALSCYRFALKVAKSRVIQHGELWRTLKKLGEKTGVDCESCAVLSTCNFGINFLALSRIYAYATKIRQLADYTPKFSSLAIFKSKVLSRTPTGIPYFTCLVEITEANFDLIKGCLDKQLFARFLIPRKKLYGPFSWDEKNLLSQIKKYPADSLSLYLLGKLYYERNDMNKAREYLERFTKLNPKNAAAFHLLATICDAEARTLKEERKAWNYLEKARDLDPHNTEILLESGITLLAFGELDNARQRLEEAKKHAIGVANLCAIDTALSEVYKRLNNPSASKKCILRAKTLNAKYYNEVRYWLEGFLSERKKWQGRLRPRRT